MNCLDAEKAFDRVSWLFLEQTMLTMGFKEEFVTWINLLYKNSKSKIRVNGHCSKFFKVERGVRWGDSLSPILFVMCIECLAEALRQNKHIQGITDEKGSVHKVALFTHDILVFIKKTTTNFSIPTLMPCLQSYGSVSGYKVNENKSEAMMISGDWLMELNKNVSFHWSKKGFRYLGVIITPNSKQLFNANYTKLIKETKNDVTR